MTRFLLFPMMLVAFAASAQLQQRIEYRWLNQPCSEIINCDAGCSACNMPSGTSGTFFGTNAAFVNVETCPLPITPGDNAVYSANWDLQPGAQKSVIISGIATVPMRIDSIRFRHAIYSTGPDRVRVTYTSNPAMAPVEVADVEVPAEFDEVFITDMGCVGPTESMPLGTFQLRFMPYGSTDGGWAVDEVVIVGTPCEASSVGIAELTAYQTNVKGPWVDLLGRPMNRNAAPGVYIAPGKRIRVVE